MPRVDDRDADGVCDGTEREVGSGVESADSDGDGASDLVEVAYDFDPLDSENPPGERVAVLRGEPNAGVDFHVRVTVTGTGDGHTGAFESEASVYEADAEASVFFRGAVAVSAEPQENVRGIDYASERFASVQGETRLAFSLRFEHPGEAGPPCVRAYPFRYVVKSSRGETANQRGYLLVVVPDPATYEAGPWCGLDRCI
jgi:hypothetical protein